MKTCYKCKRTLPLESFNKNSRNKDGHGDMCRECMSAYNRMRYASRPEKFKRDTKEYRENNPLNVFNTRMKTFEKMPSRTAAYKLVDAAVAAGVLVRPSVCSGCGCSNKEHRIEAHHHDYSKPLDVIWLCPPCHRRLDARRREQEVSAHG